MAEDTRFDVISLGSSAIDMIGAVPRQPEVDTKSQLSQFTIQAGGVMANTAVGLARLGSRCSYVGKLGRDEFSRRVIDQFRTEGVDVSGVVTEDGAGPYLAMIIVDESTGHRTILWTDQMVRALKPEELSRDLIVSGRILDLDDWGFLEGETARQAARWAKEAGMTVVVNAEDLSRRDYLPVLALTDVLLVNDQYALEFSPAESLDAAARFFLAKGAGTVIITQGRQGCEVWHEGGSFHQPAFEVDVVDSTGCGDAFRSGLIFGLLQGRPIETVAQCASAVAALKCRKLGARAGLPSLDELTEFLHSRGAEVL